MTDVEIHQGQKYPSRGFTPAFYNTKAELNPYGADHCSSPKSTHKIIVSEMSVLWQCLNPPERGAVITIH